MKKKKHSKKRKETQKKKLNTTNLLILLVLTLIISCLIIYSIILNKEENDNKTYVNNINQKNIIIDNEKEDLKTYREERINKYKKQKNDKIYEENNKDSYKEYNENLTNKKLENTNNIKKENKASVFIEKIKHEKKNKEIKKIDLLKKEPLETNKKIITKNKAKLILIIDDVSSSSQVKSILALKHNITMSFLPPSANHKNSAQIAQNLPFYMIHIPLQASKAFKFQENKTLQINNTYKEIDDYVKKIRIWYPEGKYINNHTGSKFTANNQAMDKLFKALKKYNFTFLDSRTIGTSLGEKYAKKYNMPYLSRNIFLDNNQNFSYIQNQLKKSIKIAKKNGVAIAIGHPYSITIKVLKESKDLFKDLELVYLKSHPKLN